MAITKLGVAEVDYFADGCATGQYVRIHGIAEGELDPTATENDVIVDLDRAAGITLARELNGSGVPCVLLESGGTEFDSRTQELYAGDNVGRPFPDLTTCR